MSVYNGSIITNATTLGTVDTFEGREVSAVQCSPLLLVNTYDTFLKHVQYRHCSCLVKAFIIRFSIFLFLHPPCHPDRSRAQSDLTADLYPISFWTANLRGHHRSPLVPIIFQLCPSTAKPSCHSPIPRAPSCPHVPLPIPPGLAEPLSRGDVNPCRAASAASNRHVDVRRCSSSPLRKR